MNDNVANRDGGADRRAVLLRRLSDARAILGCGDDPDRNAALDEIEAVERELREVDRDPSPLPSPTKGEGIRRVRRIEATRGR